VAFAVALLASVVAVSVNYAMLKTAVRCNKKRIAKRVRASYEMCDRDVRETYRGAYRG
jgi:hypothetical protein